MLRELIDEARAGHPGALQDLLAHLHPWVIRYATRVPEVGSETGEDVAHDICVRVLEDLHTVQGPADRVVEWIYNLLARRIAAHERLRWVETDDSRIPDGPTIDLNPEQRALCTEEVDRVVHAARRLTQLQRSVVWLRALGAPHADIAATLGVSVGTVRVCQHRASQRLRAILAAPPTTPPPPSPPTAAPRRRRKRRPRPGGTLAEQVFTTADTATEHLVHNAVQAPRRVAVCAHCQALQPDPTHDTCVWCGRPRPADTTSKIRAR